MRQLFTHKIPDASKESIDDAMRYLWQEATAMGFTACEAGVVKNAKGDGLYLDVPFYTADESKFIL